MNSGSLSDEAMSNPRLDPSEPGMSQADEDKDDAASFTERTTSSLLPSNDDKETSSEPESPDATNQSDRPQNPKSGKTTANGIHPPKGKGSATGASPKAAALGLKAYESTSPNTRLLIGKKRCRERRGALLPNTMTAKLVEQAAERHRIKRKAENEGREVDEEELDLCGISEQMQGVGGGKEEEEKVSEDDDVNGVLEEGDIVFSKRQRQGSYPGLWSACP